MKSNVSLKQVEASLELYELEEILEQNDLTVADALFALVEEGYVELPDVEPVTEWDDTNIQLVDEIDELEN